MFRKGNHYVLMAEAGEGGDPGAGGEAAGAAAGESSTGNVSSEGSQTEGSGASSEAGAAAADSSNALQQAQPHFIPEKFHVKKEDGTLDIEASAQKLAENYGHLEKRMGAGDVPPKTADDYKIEVPEALKEHWRPESDEMLQSFKKEAHSKGYTQAQFDFAMAKYFEIAPQLVNGSALLSADECVADLKKEWTTPEQYKEGVGSAYRAAQGFFGNDAEYIITTYGNDPRLIRGLSKIGSEMGEDRSIQPGPGDSSGQSIESLQMSDAYKNPKHPDHARVSKQVQDFYAKQAKEQAKTGNIPLIG